MRKLNEKDAEKVMKAIFGDLAEALGEFKPFDINDYNNDVCDCGKCKVQRNIELIAETLENCTDEYIVSFKDRKLIIANTNTNTFNKYDISEESEKMYFIKCGYGIIKEELKKVFDDYENHSKFSDLIEARNRIYHDYENLLTK